MGDSLPLIPEKGNVVADVRPILREVFRDLDCLPAVSCYKNEDETRDTWADDFASECEQLYSKEKNLKQKYAERLSREPLPNIYKMYSPHTISVNSLITRKDLKPSIEQDAGCDVRSWVKNILNKSSGDLTIKPYESHLHKIELKPADEVTIQSYSIGEAPPLPPPPPPVVTPHPPSPEYLLCVPPRIEFVNFTIGNVHTETIRLINTSKFELRLSVTPPKRRELDVELCSRLVVTSGSAAEIRIHYRPVDVRALTDELLVRVSMGKAMKIPIVCYMQPPVLEILVPNLTSSRLESMNASDVTNDVLDLGSRLLGDVHRTALLFYCSEEHASFFLLPEDAWLNYCVDISAVTKGKVTGGAASDGFWVTPVRWSGGGSTRALAVCHATAPGLHTTAFRVLCSTAIVRTLNVVADALWFRTDHITIEAHEKDYDICSEADEACEYYVRLGTAFPGRPLSATVDVINHSPVTYAYYWSVRPWGVCSCWTGSDTSLLGEDDLCDEAKMNKNEGKKGINNENAKAVRVEPAQGRLFPRSSTQLHVRVPDAGVTLGMHRAVLMLILKEIPKESFPPDFDPMIVKTEVIQEDSIPGVCSSWTREVCDIVCCQLEVWWEVVPVRFILVPPVLRLTHSRRVKSTDICIKATQLYGVNDIKAAWNISGAPAINLPPGESVGTNFNLQMQKLPNHFPDIDVIELTSESKEWKSSTIIQRSYSTRHPSLRPAFKWLGIVPPGAKVQTELVLHNDTNQHICWWATSTRWHGERPVASACKSRAPCPRCHERSCSCAMLTPMRGALDHDERITLKYCVIAPDTDGVVSTLIQVHRTSADVCMVHSVPGTEARATVLAYRVLAPVAVMRVLPCLGDKHGHCKVCSLDTNDLKDSAVLRPSFALTMGFRSCYRIKITNLTPIPTTVKWKKPIEGEDILRVLFIPNDFELNGHATKIIQVVLDPRKISQRRIFEVHASVTHAHSSIHLLIDAAISGLEVVMDIPLGDEEKTESFVSIKMTQKDSVSPNIKDMTPKDIFEEEDRRRQIQNENICHCRYKMVYIPPPKESTPSDVAEEERPVEIVTEPPPLTRVCPCDHKTKPILPDIQETYCLQFKELPLRTVKSRIIKIRNISSLFARISTAVRQWPRIHKRTLNADKWAADVQEPGIAIDCVTSQRALSPCGEVDVTVSVYADCWGLYRDQVLIKIEHLEPLVLDVWVEAVGSPLQFALQRQDNAPILWMSPSDPKRTLNMTNTSRSSLTLHSYVIAEHQYLQDELPFRLYMRFYEVPPRTCPCVYVNDSESNIEDTSDKDSSVYQEMDTQIELYLARDYGAQDHDNYTIDPTVLTMAPNSTAAPVVTMSEDPTPKPPSVILFRIIPENRSGIGWYRPDPPPVLVRLLAVTRTPKLMVLPTQLRVSVCALDLPARDILRIRKHLRVLNTGSGHLQAHAVVESPWVIRVPQVQCGAKCIGSGPGSQWLNQELLPRSSTEMVIEVTIKTQETWPKPGEKYDLHKCSTKELRFFDQQDIFLLSVPLHLDIEFPLLKAEPNKIDFGYVMDGDYRKTYFTVMHSSLSVTMKIIIDCNEAEYRVWPTRLTLPPRTAKRIYVQYIARWQSCPAEGAVRIRAHTAAGSWCAAVVALRAQPALDRATHLPAHDYTDDTHLSTH